MKTTCLPCRMPLFLIAAVFVWDACRPARAQTLKENNEALLSEVQRVHGLSSGQMESIRAIFRASGSIGQGNPAVTRHSMSTRACTEKLSESAVTYENPEFEGVCKAEYMAPCTTPPSRSRRRQGLHRPVRVPRYSLRVPRGLGGAREAAEICYRHGQAALRRP